MNEIDRQRKYYARTAGSYDSTCCFDENDEHFMALSLLTGILDHFKIKSVLDVGCGTGRAISYLQPKFKDVTFKGIEPVKELREEAIGKGLDPDCILEGDATNLAYSDGQFDCVTMFGVLHHIPNPQVAIKEAMRVSKRIVFLSDHNVYGMGSTFSKLAKQTFRDLGLRKLLNVLLTKGKGYHDTSWDGIFYPFSLIDHIPLVQRNVDTLHVYPTKTFAINIYRDASHLALLGIKEPK